MEVMHWLVSSLMGGFVGQKKGRRALGTRLRISDELTVVMHQSTPGRKKNLARRSRLLVHVGRLGDWMAERTIRRRGIQIHTFT